MAIAGRPMKKLFPFSASSGALAAALLFSGCLARPQLVKESYALQLSPPAGTTPASPSGAPILGIQSIAISPGFEGKSFVYRVADNTFEHDPYAEFMVPPDRLIMEMARTHLRHAGIFREVTVPGSLLKPTVLAEIQVTALYGDFRKGETPAAVVGMRLLVVSAETPKNQRVLLQKEYSSSAAIEERRAPALVAGWNKALEKTLGEMATDLRTLRTE
jgi:cholesterol transport system auxiliary component